MRTISIAHLPGWIFALLLATLLVGCGSDDDIKIPHAEIDFYYDGLPGRIVNRLYEHDGRLFAATDRGLYSKMIGPGFWHPAGLNGREILDVAILADGYYIASTRRLIDDAPVYSLLESTDGGDLWYEINHNFGGAEEQEAIYGLDYDADNNALYATGTTVLARSLDAGRSWEILSGSWHGFGQPNTAIKRNPATNEIWYGGQNAIEQLVLRAYSLDTGEERDLSALLPLPTPSTIHGIQFDPTNASRVLVSGEGGILETTNNGESWINLLGDVDYRFYFAVAFDPENPQILYTGGWDKVGDSPQPLIFEVSRDGGVTWDKYKYPSDILYGGVRSVIAVKEGVHTVVYLGLYGGGIMKVVVF